ncbi:acetyl-coenzyme A synthetase [Nephila pilipes]|uniref:Acetyl-coenzyme A synthetase n=1 Tax=Nephila pilipes TaxID=299642 RepID=A0A8X6UCZ7_NEPPI|nr:acetyl-coenzyme A synthetase [Nephila pilipes]
MANKTKRIANGNGTNGNYVFRATEEQKSRSHLGSLDEFWRLHRKSLEDPNTFWSEAAAPFYWKVPLPKEQNIGNYNIDVRKGRVSIEWLKGASTNICYNALDRNVQNGHGEQIAYYCFRISTTVMNESDGDSGTDIYMRMANAYGIEYLSLISEFRGCKNFCSGRVLLMPRSELVVISLENTGAVQSLVKDTRRVTSFLRDCIRLVSE